MSSMDIPAPIANASFDVLGLGGDPFAVASDCGGLLPPNGGGAMPAPGSVSAIANRIGGAYNFFRSTVTHLPAQRRDASACTGSCACFRTRSPAGRRACAAPRLCSSMRFRVCPLRQPRGWQKLVLYAAPLSSTFQRGYCGATLLRPCFACPIPISL